MIDIEGNNLRHSKSQRVMESDRQSQKITNREIEAESQTKKRYIKRQYDGISICYSGRRTNISLSILLNSLWIRFKHLRYLSNQHLL